MSNNIFYNILNKKRLKFLPLFKNFKKDFYLAGGTALALQIGHRDSIDFDFFTKKDIDTKKLFEEIKRIFKDYKIIKVQEERNTLSVIVNNTIKLSFFTYKYNLVEQLVKTEYFNFASIIDIACMKLSAIINRAVNKDYVDLYYILQKITLFTLLDKMKWKFPDIDINLASKSLIFFSDVEQEPLRFRNNNKVSFKKIKDYFKKEIKKLYN